MGQPMIHRKRLIGSHKMFCDCCADHGGHGLSAILLRHINPGPAARFEFLKGVFESAGGVNRACLPPTALAITNRIQRGDNRMGQLARFV